MIKHTQKPIFFLIFTLFLTFFAFKAKALTEASEPDVGIPDSNANGISDSIFIDTTGTIADVDVTIEIEHDWIGDLLIVLEHVETGTEVTLLDQIGANDQSQDELGCGLNDVYVTFDHETPELTQSQCDAAASFAYGSDGTFRYVAADFSDPTYLEACIAAEYQCNANATEGLSGTFKTDDGTGTGLSDFYTENSYGTWRLTVSDLVTNDTGILVAWSISFSDTNCGNGIREQAEECDDGNSTSNDGCSATCEITYDNDGDSYFDDADCDDGDINIHPGATEICGDGEDNDCDGTSIELITWYYDSDGDGYGDNSQTQQSCAQPSVDYVEFNGDCDETDMAIFPGAEEVIDDEDNDCDDLIDEGTTVYDDDGDGLSEEDGDCNDESADAFPDGTEVCDGIDNDCNGIIDDELSEECETANTLPDDSDTTDESGNSSSGSSATADELQNNARNPLRSDLLAAGCSLQTEDTFSLLSLQLFFMSLVVLSFLRVFSNFILKKS